MKLSTQQVNALVEQIKQEYNKEVTDYNKIITDKENKIVDKILSTKGAEMLKQFIQYSKDNSNNTGAVRYFLKNTFPDKFKDIPKTKNIISWQHDIKNKIILKTIECDNLDELIKSIKESL